MNSRRTESLGILGHYTKSKAAGGGRDQRFEPNNKFGGAASGRDTRPRDLQVSGLIKSAANKMIMDHNKIILGFGSTDWLGSAQIFK